MMSVTKASILRAKAAVSQSKKKGIPYKTSEKAAAAMDNIGKPTLSGLVSKIRNIDGKPLRSAIRNVKPSIVNEGDTLHGVAEAATVNKSPNRVSFDDNIRVSLINPNEQPNHTKSSDVNKESSRVSFVN
nr:hypothetical protein [Tanacetum cinerariifolium]